MRVRHAATVAIVAFVGSGGCRQILGVDDYGVVAPVTTHPEAGTFVVGSDGIKYESAACAECTTTRCKKADDTCKAVPACLAMASCLAACSPNHHDCRSRCALTIPATPEFSALVQCEARSCPGKCAASRVVWGRSQCDACLVDQCPDALDAFSVDPSGLHAEPCDDPLCSPVVPRCACDRYGDGAPRSLAVLDCVNETCNAECNPLEDWSCVGSMPSPPQPRQHRDLQLHFSLVPALGGGDPPDSFRVAACNDLEENCGFSAGDGGTERNAIAAATSDPITKEALLVIPPPTTATALDGAFFGHLYVEAVGNGAPAVYYFFPPLLDGPSYVVRRIVSRALADYVAHPLVPDGLDWTNKGGIAWTGLSCEGGAPGMEITIDPAAKVYYLPNPGSSTVTNQEGIGFAWDVTPGQKRLTAKHDGKLVGTYDVRVFPGTITHLVIRPVH